MTMLRFGPLLAIAGAACLVAWTPEGRPPRPEVATLDRGPGSGSDAPPTETASVTRAAQSASTAAPTIGYGSASSAGAELAAVSASPPPEASLSDANLASQFAYADVPEPAQGRAVDLSAPSTNSGERLCPRD